MRRLGSGWGKVEAETQQIQSPKTESIFQKTAGSKDLPGSPVFKCHRPSNAGVLGTIPSQRTTSHMLQLRVPMLQLKILHAAAKTQCSQMKKINNNNNTGRYLNKAVM